MWHRVLALGAGVLAAMLTGCESGHVDDPPYQSPTPSVVNSPTPSPTAEASTFARIQRQVFDVSCSSDSCHSHVGRAGDLVLEEAESWDDLVEAEPANAVARSLGQMRVMPHRPDKSLLLAKLYGNLQAGQGLRMPYGAAPLATHTVDVIAAWIAAGAPPQGRVVGDDGSDLGTGGDNDGRISLPAPARGVQLTATSPPVAVGAEETGCHFLKLPSAADLDVNRIQVAVSGGSHHIHLYRPYDSSLDIPDHYEVCNQAVDFDQWELVVAVQLRENDWELPPGVAFHFRAGEQLLMQTHFVNVGSLETRGEGQVFMNLHTAEAGTVTAHAGAMFGQDRDVVVPPYSETTLAAECVFPKPLTLIAQTGHYHFRGRRFRTYEWTAGSRGDLIYEHIGYDDPAFTIYPAGSEPQFASGAGLQWECLWENHSPTTYTFGPFTDTNEHCNWFGFYYPTESLHESITCVKDAGVATTVVRQGY